MATLPLAEVDDREANVVSPYTYSQRFGLDGPRDLVDKLWYDICRLHAAGTVTRDDVAYVAFDCAVTAWSIVDWIAHTIDSETSERLGLSPIYTRAKRHQIYAILKGRIKHFELCYQLATRAKHFDVSVNPRDDVGTSNITVRTRKKNDQSEKIDVSFSHSLFVNSDGGSVPADELFGAVHAGLTRFLDDEAIDVRNARHRMSIDWTRYD